MAVSVWALCRGHESLARLAARLPLCMHACIVCLTCSHLAHGCSPVGLLGGAFVAPWRNNDDSGRSPPKFPNIPASHMSDSGGAIHPTHSGALEWATGPTKAFYSPSHSTTCFHPTLTTPFLNNSTPHPPTLLGEPCLPSPAPSTASHPPPPSHPGAPSPSPRWPHRPVRAACAA